MNARQKAKKQKKEIKSLKSDNDLMRRIIADTPAMQELYDAYNSPKFVTHTTMQFHQYKAKRIIPNHITEAAGLTSTYITDAEELIEYTKQAATNDLIETIKESITYEIDDKGLTPAITASIFIGEGSEANDKRRNDG